MTRQLKTMQRHLARRKHRGRKLTPELVNEIKDLMPYMTDSELAPNYRVSVGNMWQIRHQYIWKDI